MKRRGIFLIGILIFSCGCFLGKIVNGKSSEKGYHELKERLAKFESYFSITNKWLKNKNQGISVVEYFKKRNYNRIAIYGMGELGKRLYEDLAEAGVSVRVVFDRNAQRLDPALNVYGLDKPITDLDVVVITPTFDYDSIEEQLKKIVSCDIVSINDVILG